MSERPNCRDIRDCLDMLAENQRLREQLAASEKRYIDLEILSRRSEDTWQEHQERWSEELDKRAEALKEYANRQNWKCPMCNGWIGVCGPHPSIGSPCSLIIWQGPLIGPLLAERALKETESQ